jgi:hypothetical protein
MDFGFEDPNVNKRYGKLKYRNGIQLDPDILP